MNRDEVFLRLHHHRCVDCGFLGSVARPDSSRELAELGEVLEEHRQPWRSRLRTARETGKIDKSEYDRRRMFDLGIDSGTPYGVMCGLGRPEGPGRPAFHVPGPRETQADFLQHRSEGYIISEPDDSTRSLFGRVLGVSQTFVWPLVRPHRCPAFMKHREGLRPADHVTAREATRRWRRGAVMTVIGIVLGALLGWWLGG